MQEGKETIIKDNRTYKTQRTQLENQNRFLESNCSPVSQPMPTFLGITYYSLPK